MTSSILEESSSIVSKALSRASTAASAFSYLSEL
jgi:hypothetical protein